jgi:predicted PurR-regulated permease PerM
MKKDTNQQGSKLFILSGILASALIASIIGLLRLISRTPPKKQSSLQSTSTSPVLEPPSESSPSVRVTTPQDKAPRNQVQTSTVTQTSTDLPRDKTKSSIEPIPEPQESQPTRWSMPTKYIVGIGIFLSVLFIFYISRSVISLFVVSALIAFIIQPIINYFQRRFKLKRGISVGFTYLLVLIILLLIPIIFIPAVVNAINFALEIDYQAILENIAQIVANIEEQIDRIPVVNSIAGPAMDSLVKASSSLTDLENPDVIEYDTSLATISTRLAQTLGLLVNILGPMVSAVVSFVFMLLISIHMSLSGDKLRQWYPTLIPPRYQAEIEDLVKRIEMIWASFLRSQLVLMVVIGTVVWLGNVLLGTPQAFFLGVMAGILEIIPNLGPFLATIPAVVLAIFFGSEHFAINNLLFALIVIGFYILVQTLENQLLVPTILGDAVDLPPLVVIIGVVVGGASAGILGVFLSTPIIATGREIYGYLYKKILEPHLEEAPPEDKPSLMESIQDYIRGIRLPFGRNKQRLPEN